MSCVLDDDSGRHVVFGYNNGDGDHVVAVPGGPDNHYEPELDVRFATGALRPPPTFLPGDHPAAFAVTLTSPVTGFTWHLGSQLAHADGAPTCRKTVANGETKLEVMDGETVAGSVVIAPNLDGALVQTLTATDRPDGVTAAGSTEGVFRVTDDGAANYTIPLWVPPGRAGVQPTLSLAYDSSGSNGLLGVGWTLSGFSQIARCPAAATKTRPARPVRFVDPPASGSSDNGSDQFCLDGDPLLLGTDGALHPQRDPFARVRPSMDGSKIVAWVLEQRNGQVLDYRDTLDGVRVIADETGHENPPADLNLAAATHVTLAWLVSEVHDRSGNSMEFHYYSADLDRTKECQQPDDLEPWKPCFAFERRPLEITYTHGNFDAKKSVTLEYEERDDADIAYVAGFPLKRSGRLSTVTMRGPKPVSKGILRTYQFSYTSSPMNDRSLLSSVKECDGEGVCKPATTFEYEPGSSTFDRQWIGDLDHEGAPNFPSLTDQHLHVADIDGDGKDDLIYERDDVWYSRLSAGKDFRPEVPINPPPKFGICGSVSPMPSPLRKMWMATAPWNSCGHKSVVSLIPRAPTIVPSATA